MSFQETCTFCKIIKGSIKANIIYEDSSFLAFLSIYPISTAVTVVIPKKHCTSDVFALPSSEYVGLLECARHVSSGLQIALGAKRIAMVAEGMMIDHGHIKLYPLIHGITSPEYGAKIEGKFNAYYQGYLTTLEGPRCSDQQLDEWQELIIRRGR